ncbi:Penicillinase repressor [Posidoniimonas polymericola]|uniref:Penicillinase repressor n=1 Tax=Posidoniimonas polymericola TaxID=2528002 RepID=A0A5C5ZDH6_9BACT|nr:BlaI/MecI/CopY family transcriptional regulator [Posidoniimonas polymericola]TWT85469.1 Penicillinase repressor [Posidoniimonas polymericola]
MARPESEFPTDLELEILKVLWAESPLPVREVRARLEADANRPLTHSSVITVLNIMHRKGYLERTKEGKSFLFAPRVDKQQVSQGFVGDLLTRLFDGSPSAMVLNLLEGSDVDADELAELRKLIARKAARNAKEQQ